MLTRTLSQRWGGILLAILLVVSGAATAGERSTGQVIDDATITTKVKASFVADPQVSALAIDVDTADGVVSLTGVVEGEPERQRAIQLAQGIEGVKRVDANNLRDLFDILLAGHGTLTHFGKCFNCFYFLVHM
jgi:BON domain